MSRASFTVPARSRTQAPEVKESEQRVLCNHQIPARRLMSRTAAHPNRWFYSCAKDREDPKRCKFFKWEDQLPGASPAKPKGQTLGGAPGTPSRLMRPTPGSATPKKPSSAVTPSKSSTPGKLLQAKLNNAAGVETPSAKRLRRWNDKATGKEDISDESEEIDWGAIDTDKLEEEARSVTNTPRAIRFDSSATQSETRKRKLDAVGGDGDSNPFLVQNEPKTPSILKDTPSAHTPATLQPTTPGGTAGPHPALGALTMAVDEINQYLARQDRHVRAAQTMKTSMRESIRSLQDKVKQLEGGEGSEPVKKLQDENVHLGQENVRLRDENTELKERLKKLEDPDRDKEADELRQRIKELEDADRDKQVIIQALKIENRQREMPCSRIHDEHARMRSVLKQAEFFADHAQCIKEGDDSKQPWYDLEHAIRDASIRAGPIPLKEELRPRCKARDCGLSYPALPACNSDTSDDDGIANGPSYLFGPTIL